MREVIDSERFSMQPSHPSAGTESWLAKAVYSATGALREAPIETSGVAIAAAAAVLVARRYRPALELEKAASSVTSAAESVPILDSVKAPYVSRLSKFALTDESAKGAEILRERMSFSRWRYVGFPEDMTKIPTFSVEGLSSVGRYPVPSVNLVARNSVESKVFQNSRASILPVFQGDSWGATGFVVDESGLIATANHVVPDLKQQTWIRLKGENIPAQIASRDVRSDLALLKVERPDLLPRPLPLTINGPDLYEGRSAFLIGFPHGARVRTMTKGHLKILDFTETPPGLKPEINIHTGKNGLTGLVWHTADTFGGNSGGPLLLDNGLVAAVHTNNRGDGIFARGISSIHLDTMVRDLKANPVPGGIREVSTFLLRTPAVKPPAAIETAKPILAAPAQIGKVS